MISQESTIGKIPHIETMQVETVHEDPITFEPITDITEIKFIQYGVPFHFDINSLAAHVSTGNTWNPLNRQPLPKDVLEELQRYNKQEFQFMVTMHHSAKID